MGKPTFDICNSKARGAFHAFDYASAPSLDRSRAALVHVAIWIVATALLTLGVGLVTQGREALGEPFATVGSLALVADLVFFGVLFFRAGRAAEVGAAPVAAE